jgi:hypothetical protein
MDAGAIGVATTHVVKQDEHLSGIAAEHGFADFHLILDHPKNADLKARRDPHVLFPGDEVFIPDRTEKTEQGATTRIHTFAVDQPPLFLRLRLRDLDDKAIDKAPYELRVESADAPDAQDTDGNGVTVAHEIERPVKNGELTVKHKLPPLPPARPGDKPPPREETFKFDLKIGRLNPETMLSGQQARLNNLGYFAGFTPADTDEMLWAIEEFQCDHMGQKPVTKKPVIKPESTNPRDNTGVQDKATQQALLKQHGI